MHRTEKSYIPGSDRTLLNTNEDLAWAASSLLEWDGCYIDLMDRFFRVKCGKKLASDTSVFYHEFKSLLIVPDMVLGTPMYALLKQWFDIYIRRVRNSG